MAKEDWKLPGGRQAHSESIGEFLIRCAEPPICTVRNHRVYSMTMNDKTSYIVVQVSSKGDYKDTIVQGHLDGVERWADTLDEALEQIIWVYKKNLLEIGWRNRETLMKQGYYQWEKEIKAMN
jgi:exoribonuclease II